MTVQCIVSFSVNKITWEFILGLFIAIGIQVSACVNLMETHAFRKIALPFLELSWTRQISRYFFCYLPNNCRNSAFTNSKCTCSFPHMLFLWQIVKGYINIFINRYSVSNFVSFLDIYGYSISNVSLNILKFSPYSSSTTFFEEKFCHQHLFFPGLTQYFLISFLLLRTFISEFASK